MNQPNRATISRAVSRALYQHDRAAGLSEDLFIIRTEELDQLCLEAANDILQGEQP